MGTVMFSQLIWLLVSCRLCSSCSVLFASVLVASHEIIQLSEVWWCTCTCTPSSWQISKSASSSFLAHKDMIDIKISIWMHCHFHATCLLSRVYMIWRYLLLWLWVFNIWLKRKHHVNFQRIILSIAFEKKCSLPWSIVKNQKMTPKPTSHVIPFSSLVMVHFYITGIHCCGGAFDIDDEHLIFDV